MHNVVLFAELFSYIILFTMSPCVAFRVTKWNTCVLGNNYLSSLPNMALQTCINQCNIDNSCDGIQYSLQMRMCRLIGQSLSSVFDENCPGNIVINGSDLAQESISQPGVPIIRCDISPFTSCGILGNMYHPGNRIKLVCSLAEYSCRNPYMICNDDGNWTVDSCESSTQQEHITSISQNKPVTQFTLNVGASSNYVSPDQAVDGNTDGGFFRHSCASTEQWWMVDLEQTYDIRRVEIYPRTDNCCYERFKDISVYVSDNDVNPPNIIDDQLCQSFPGPPAVNHEPVNFDCGGTLYGRYVKVHQPTSEYAMVICEVFVY